MNTCREKFIVRGGLPLHGEIQIKAAKNSVLPLIACSVLSNEDITLHNVPLIEDIKTMLCIVRSLGGAAEFRDGEIRINCKHANPILIESKLTESLRASIFMLGPTLARFKRVRLGLPGGCAIGERAIDIHIAGLRALGVVIEEFADHIECDATNFSGGVVTLRMPSVGATENLMMASVLGKQTTVIRNAAREPEIVDLARLLNQMGAHVLGAGSDTIEIEGVTLLGGAVFRPSCDRIAAPTYLCAAAVTGGSVVVRGANHILFDSSLQMLEKMGCQIGVGGDVVSLVAPSKLCAIPFLETQPHPGFPTDMQPQITAALCVANGRSTMVENLFENRFRYAEQLKKLGADITIAANIAQIQGVRKLYGADVTAEDLRGGAALVLAAVAAEGSSVVRDIFHIDRGYERLENTLRDLGADITRTADIL